MSVNLKSLIGKLNQTTRGALEGAAGLCLSRTNYDIEIEHYLLKLLDQNESDLQRILSAFGVDKGRVSASLTESLDKLKTGNARTPALSPTLVEMFSEAWLLGSVDYGGQAVRSGYTIVALVTNEKLSRMLFDDHREMRKIHPAALRRDFASIVAASREETDVTGVRTEAPASGGPPGSRPPAKASALDQFTINVTENARKGKIDPVLGRDFEIRQMIDILTRRRQNNPILTGEAGVGKTAVVEGLALRIVDGDVPPPLKNVSLRTLDMALLQAGAGVKGEFENRLKTLIEEVKASPSPIILFIDEAHTMIGAGGQAGQSDAANLLKPALARGELRTIAATTWSEYKKYFEKDAALARRFQVVKVEEPSETSCTVMLRGIAPALENHHNVRILDEAVAGAVHLSHRYLSDRFLPDKAVSVLDTACARLALGQNTVPAVVEDAKRTLDDLDRQKRILEREQALGADHTGRLAEIAAQRESAEAGLAAAEERWKKEAELVGKVREVRSAIEQATAPVEAQAVPAPAMQAAAAPNASVASAAEAAAPSVPDVVALKTDLARLNAELDAVQGESPLMRVSVDRQVITEVISGWTGIPVGKMLKDEIETVLALDEHLGKRVIGQHHALRAIAERIRISRATLEDPVKPVGVFLLVGPSGVGKTETALALSDLLYGGERNVITINMSEFQEAHTVSTLKGSPPGYVGYGEGGVLTEAVRRRPYSVVLLDEVEKAHPDVLELFFQVFDKGRMEDGEGREIDFKNTIIILTSNAASETIAKLMSDPETAPSGEALVRSIKPELNKIFKPAFLGRLVIIPYLPISDESMKSIIRLKLGRIERRVHANHRIRLTWDDALVDEVAKRCTEVESGARNVDNILTHTLLPEISRQILGDLAEQRRRDAVHVSVGETGAFVYA